MEVKPVRSGAGPTGPGLNAAPDFRDGQELIGKVLSASGNTAQVEVNGRIITVSTQTALAPGDQLELKAQAGTEGPVRLVVLGKQGAGSVLSSAHLRELVQQLGFPASESPVGAAKLLLEEAGTVSPGALKELLRQPAGDRPAVALLMARNLPTTPEAIKLAKEFMGVRAEPAGKRLSQRLKALRAQGALPEALEALELPASDQSTDLSDALRLLARAYTPLEAELGRNRVDAGGGSDDSGAGDQGQPQGGADDANHAGSDTRPPENRLTQSDSAIGHAPSEGLERLKLAGALSKNVSFAIEKFLCQDGQLKFRGTREEPVPARSQLEGLKREICAQQLLDSSAGTGLAYPEVRLPLILGGDTGELLLQRWAGNPKDPLHARVVITLDMSRLGPLKVDLLYSKGQVSGHIAVSDRPTGDFLSARLDDLKAGISGTGVGVGNITVALSHAESLTVPGHFDVRR